MMIVNVLFDAGGVWVHNHMGTSALLHRLEVLHSLTRDMTDVLLTVLRSDPFNEEINEHQDTNVPTLSPQLQAAWISIRKRRRA